MGHFYAACCQGLVVDKDSTIRLTYSTLTRKSTKEHDRTSWLIPSLLVQSGSPDNYRNVSVIFITIHCFRIPPSGV